MTNKWHLAALENPSELGKYMVRLSNKNDVLAPTVDILAEFSTNGWCIPMYLILEDDYYVSSWRYM